MSGLARPVIFVCVPFAAGFYLSYVYRSINAVIAGDLGAELSLDAADLGLLTAAYFLGFAAFQLPVGIFLDRYGPRRVQSVLLLVAALGAVIFAAGHDNLTLVAGRALIGAGVAGALMGSFKAITMWFPARHWPLMNGVIMTVGGIGAMSATTPVQALLGVTDWRTIFYLLAGLTVAVAALIFLVVPERGAATATRSTLREQIGALGVIYSDRFFWRLAPITILPLAGGLAIQGLWAGPWLRDVAGLEPAQVAEHLFVLTVWLTLGFLATGLFAGIGARFGVDKLKLVGVGAGVMMVILALLSLGVAPRGYWVWSLFGFFSNVTIVAFPALSEHFTKALAGRSNTALNLINFLTAFLLQYVIGGIIARWPETESGGYDPEAYAVAFLALNLLIAASFVWFLVARRGVE